MRSKLSILILVLIIALGAFLRFYHLPQLGFFGGDQATELLSTAQILHGKLTLIGIKTSNSEIRNGAVMYYLMAPILYLFNYDPAAGGVTQSLLSLGTIVVVYLLSKRISPGYSWIIACSLIAFSPLLVDFSRQTLLAFYPLFFSALFLLFLIKISETHNSNILMIIFVGFLLGFMLQIHYATLGCFLTAALYPLIVDREKIVRFYCLLILGILIGFSPMLLFEIRHQFFNSKMFLSFLGTPKMIEPGFNLIKFFGVSVSRLFFGSNIWLTGIFLSFLGVTLWRKKHHLSGLEKIVWLQILTTIIFTIFFVQRNIPHYLLPAVAPLALLVGSLSIFKNNFLFALLGAALILTINFPFYRLNDHPAWNAITTKAAAKIIVQESDSRRLNVAMIEGGENQGLPLRYFLYILHRDVLPIDNYAAAQELYVVTEPKSTPDNTSLWEITSFGPHETGKIWPLGKGYSLFQLAK